MSKKDGGITIFISLIAFFIVTICICFSFTIRKLDFTRNYIEDGLVASNLAAATIDLKEYGTTKNIINNDFEKSFRDFSNSLKVNLDLDEKYISKNKIIDGSIKVDIFRIYNVKGEDIEIITKDNGQFKKYKYNNSVGKISTPDGVIIKNTTIYSKISFTIKTIFNQEKYVSKENSVDITNNQ